MTDDLKALVQHYVEQVWNLGNVAALAELTMPAFTYHLGRQRGA